MRHTTVLVTIALMLAHGPVVPLDDGGFSAEGAVVAVQMAKDGVRAADRGSVGDMVEVWMVRIDNWPRHKKPYFILVEYTHHDPVIGDKKLGDTLWKFEIHPAPKAESQRCMSWWAADQSSVPTAFGVRKKLPPPSELTCFLMQKHPTALNGRERGAPTVE